MRELFFTDTQKKARQGGEKGSGSSQTFRAHPAESHYTKQINQIAQDAQSVKKETTVKSLLGAASKVATGALTVAFPRVAMLAKVGAEIVKIPLGANPDEYFSSKQAQKGFSHK